MKLLHKIGILIFLVLFLNSCGSGGGVTQQYNPKTGTQGVDFKFIENAPPKETYEDSTLPIAIEMENKGAADVLEGYLVWNIPQALFSYDEQVEYFELYGRTINNPQGEIKNYYEYIKTKKLPTVQEIQKATIAATLCYGYETEFSDEVCFDPTLIEQKGLNKPCEVKDLSSSGQGAPLAITKVEVAMIQISADKVNPRFTIHVSNKGKGRIVNQDEVITACSSQASESLFNVVFIEDARLSKIYNLECSGLQLRNDLGANYIVLYDNVDNSFICEFPDGISKSEGTFLTPLYIKLGYGYMETKSTKVDIKNKKT